MFENSILMPCIQRDVVFPIKTNHPLRISWSALVCTLVFSCLGGGCPWLGSSAVAQQAFQKDEIDAGISKAISFLLTQQKPNGSITDRGHENAMTALAIMAMASVGHQPSDPTPEGIAMTRGLRFLLGEGRQDKSGYFGAADVRSPCPQHCTTD